MKTMLKQAQANWMIQTVVELEDHLVTRDGVPNFENEVDSMDMLKEHLEGKGIKITATNNPLLCFQEWLESEQPNEEELQDFAFLHNVRLSPALSDKLAATLTKKNQAEKIARCLQRLHFEWKALEREENDLEAERKKGMQALKRAQSKLLKERQKREELALEAPKLVEASSHPPRHDSPSAAWKRQKMHMFLQIRSIVEDVCVTHTVNAPSFVGTSTAASSNEPTSVSEALKVVGMAAEMFAEHDLSNMTTVAAHLKTWLLVPWLESFQSIVKSFYETLTSPDIEGVTHRHLTALVGSHVAKKIKAAERGEFGRIVEAIGDGVTKFPDSKNKDDATQEDENAVADIEAESDLNDTEHGAAMLNALRDLNVGDAAS